MKEVIAQLPYIIIFITMNLKINKTQQRYHVKLKKNVSRKNTNQIDKSLQIT